MLKRNNNADLIKLEIDEMYHLLYQTWKELTDRRTIGSYQYKIMNSISALRELYDVIGLTLDGTYSTNHSVAECQGETLRILRKDRVLADGHRATYNQLLSRLGRKSKDEAELHALQYHIKYCYDAFSPTYLEEHFSALEKAVSQSEQDKIMQNTEIIISYCASLGWSTPALYEAVDVLRGSSSNSEAWLSLRENISTSTPKPFTVFIPLNLRYKTKNKSRQEFGNTVQDLIRSMNIEIRPYADVRELFKNGVNQALPERNFMVIETEAFDCFAACHSTINACSDVLNMLTFYNYIESWRDEETSCWVLYNNSDCARVLRNEDLFGSISYMVSNQRVFEASKQLMRRKDTSVSSKLRAAFAYAGMGKASGSQEERFMSTWVALESLCRSSACENIISCILETVPVALCSRYVYRLLRNFIADCDRCRIDSNFADDTFDFMKHRPRRAQVQALSRCLRDETGYKDLLSKCKINCLLEQRCLQLHNLMSNPRRLFEKVEEHRIVVRMQLCRLYRIRNSIAHSGSTNTDSLALFTEHLDDYLINFVSQVATTATDNNEDSAEVVFEIIKNNYSAFRNIASSTKNAAADEILRNLLQDGIIDLVPAS